MCGGLVTVSKDGRIIFVHGTAKEFLQQEARIHSSRGYCMGHVPAHEMIAKSCLKYLAFEDFRENFDENEPSFLHYAAVFWTTHYKYAEKQSATLAGLLQHLLEIDESSHKIHKWTAGMAQPDPFESPLHLCSRFGFLGLARIYLEMGGDPNSLNACGQRPLHSAVGARSNSTEMVKILLERGADVNSVDADHMTALHLAAHRGNLESAKLLISSGANVNAISRTYGEAPLHLAVTSASVEVAKLLIESGADVHWATYHAGETALHLASSRGLSDVVACLLERCDTYTRNSCIPSNLRKLCT
jgi:hypothetical protein